MINLNKLTNYKFLSNENVLKRIKTKTLQVPHLFIVFNENINFVTINNLLKLKIPIILFSKLNFLKYLLKFNKTKTKNKFENIKIKKFTFGLFYSIFKK